MIRAEDTPIWIPIICDADFRNSKTTDESVMSAISYLSVGFAEQEYKRCLSQGGE